MIVTRAFLICVFGLMAVHAMSKSGPKCDKPIAHYREIGCGPIYTRRSGPCPERYECPYEERDADPNKCYYKSKVFNIGEAAEKDVIEHPCSASCVCSLGYDGRASLTCANVECPDLFEPPNPDGKRCVKQYRLRDCCSHKEICDSAEISALKTCKWDSTEYREGEKFYPSGTCKQCICSDTFDGTLESIQCSRINCAIEIFHGNDIRDGCAPVYLESRRCCPIDWRCSGKNDTIVELAAKKSSNMAMKCSFGSKKLDIGDQVMTDDKCVSCTCLIPPLVTCTRKLGC